VRTTTRTPDPLRARPHHYILWGALAVLALVLPTAPAAQPARLADDPITLDRAGVILRVPENTTAQTRALAGREVATLTLPDGLGVIVVQPRRTPDTGDRTPTPDRDAAELIAGILRLDRDQPFDPLRQRPATDAGRFLGPGPVVETRIGPTRALYARLRAQGAAAPVIRGVAVLPTAPDRRVVFDLITSSVHEEAARAAFEAVLASTVLRQADIAERASEARRRSAAALLADVTPDQFAGLLADETPQFERLYRPAPSGSDAEAEELGYRRTIARVGTRRDVIGSDDDDPGYAVAVDARLLGEDGRIIDSRALYFLSRNRREEAWSVTMSVRTDGRPTTFAETGARSGRDLTVSIARGRTGNRTIRPKLRVEGFLSRVESLLLPRVLAALADTRPLTFASFDSSTESVVERTEHLERTNDGWRLRTEYADGRGQTSALTRTGEIVRTELDSGLVWEPTDFQTLFRLWTAKGLPLD